MNKNIIKLFAILMMCFMICAVLVACSSTQGAQGPKGDKGDSIKGEPGEPGKDGATVEIGQDGYWYINGEKTEWKAEGKDATECNLVDHDWQIEDFRPHTQYATGLKIGICSDCGDAKWVVEDHEFNQAVTVDPTCTVDGYTEYYCVCGALNESLTVVLPATGHSHVAVETEPTCYDDGFVTYTCACGDSYVEDGKAALGHDYVPFDETNIDASWSLSEPKPGLEPCLEQDVYVTACKRCGEYIEALTTPLGHDLGEEKLAENQQDVCYCQDQLVYVTKCERPGCSHEVERLGDPIQHNHGDWKVTVTPTATSAGQIKKVCANADKCKSGCPFCTLVEELPALDEVKYTLTHVDATCAKEGSDTYTYNKYPSVKVVVTIAKTAHNYENGTWKVLVAPKNNAAGSVEFKCNHCTHTATFTLPALSDERYTKTEGSCATQKDTYEILVNGANVKFTVAHDYAHSFPSEETLQADGVYYIYTVRYCAACDEWVVIDAKLKDNI